MGILLVRPWTPHTQSLLTSPVEWVSQWARYFIQLIENSAPVMFQLLWCFSLILFQFWLVRASAVPWGHTNEHPLCIPMWPATPALGHWRRLWTSKRNVFCAQEAQELHGQERPQSPTWLWHPHYPSWRPIVVKNLLENVMIYPDFKHRSILGSNKWYLSLKNVEEVGLVG